LGYPHLLGFPLAISKTPVRSIVGGADFAEPPSSDFAQANQEVISDEFR
jgi:hypothetical protein